MRRRRKPTVGPRARSPGSLYPTLDLHGLTAEEATSRALGWLERSQREGELTVRIITGRGRHSVGPAVLPGEIAHLLGSLPDIVASYEKEASGGAYHVRLKAPRLPRKVPRVVLPADPNLLRRAEESLAELGIALNPTLLAAEIERIRAEDERESK